MVSERLALFFLAVKLFGLLEVVDCYSSERIAFFFFPGLLGTPAF